MIRLGVLGSTRGSHLLGLIQHIQHQKLQANIEIVLSNKIDAQILERARANKIRAQFVDPANLTREAYDANVAAIFAEHAVDLIVLIGYMRILSVPFIQQWEGRIINVHPSLLPAFAGKMDLEVHRAVLAAGVEETGCTVHFVTAEVDAGPILVQRKCPVLAQDTPDTLKRRVQQLENEALVAAIKIAADIITSQ